MNKILYIAISCVISSFLFSQNDLCARYQIVDNIDISYTENIANKNTYDDEKNTSHRNSSSLSPSDDYEIDSSKNESNNTSKNRLMKIFSDFIKKSCKPKIEDKIVFDSSFDSMLSNI